MIVDYFLNYISSRMEISIKFEQEFKRRVKKLHIKKGGQLLYPGEPCRFLYFIESGFFSVFEVNQLEERTTRFAGPNDFITSPKGFFMQTSVNDGIICEQEATIFSISYIDWIELEKLFPEFIILTKKLLIEHLLESQKENEIYRTATSIERYLFLKQRYPSIQHVISQKKLASYLGVTAPSFSNILKRLLKRK